jgi:cysteine synthase
MNLLTAHSILDLIGQTPVLELTRIKELLGLDGQIWAKLENLNPGGSKKDRVALAIVREARRSGMLNEGRAVVEVTSGNTGTGLAIVCRALGHPFYAVMSRGNSPERAQMMRAFGAEVVIVDQARDAVPGKVSSKDLDLVRERAKSLVAETGAFFADQFENPANAHAHETGTAVELWQQVGERLDAIVAFVGSGGALAGMARYLRSKNPDLRVYVVEPAQATSLSACCCSDSGHTIQGGGYGMSKLSLMKDIAVTQFLSCSDDAATSATRMLALHEGVLAGYSTGAQLHAACELLRGPEKGNSLAFLVCDTGMKYLSTSLYP